jgi:hypothetical protein
MKRNCNSCGIEYEAKRPNSKYHDDTCRKRGSRSGDVIPLPDQPVPAVPDAVAPLLAATKRELEAAGVAETALGQQAIELARRMSDPRAMGLSVAPISKELRSVMADALKVAPSASGLDELRKRRDAKRHAG